MFIEDARRHRYDAESVAVGTADSEIFVPKFKGELIDEIRNIVTGEVEIRTGQNLVVNSCSKLIAALMKGGFDGIKYLEVGSGSGSWSDSSPPSPSGSDTALLTPLYRKAVTSGDIKFIDSSNNESPTPTNRIEIVVTFGPSEGNGYLRELALFGGNATSTLGSGIMINRKTHGVIYKTNLIELKRTLRLTF